MIRVNGLNSFKACGYPSIISLKPIKWGPNLITVEKIPAITMPKIGILIATIFNKFQKFTVSYRMSRDAKRLKVSLMKRPVIIIRKALFFVPKRIGPIRKSYLF